MFIQNTCIVNRLFCSFLNAQFLIFGVNKNNIMELTCIFVFNRPRGKYKQSLIKIHNFLSMFGHHGGAIQLYFIIFENRNSWQSIIWIENIDNMKTRCGDVGQLPWFCFYSLDNTIGNHKLLFLANRRSS